eukprot:GEMP01077195.1.p2 GENE.GEMP01077195.1~~GEMP01077195.1.p2  ORF type:complete len:194 (+),score=41.77 GEMP01077195.1:53-634(+)
MNSLDVPPEAVSLIGDINANAALSARSLESGAGDELPHHAIPTVHDIDSLLNRAQRTVHPPLRLPAYVSDRLLQLEAVFGPDLQRDVENTVTELLLTHKDSAHPVLFGNIASGGGRQSAYDAFVGMPGKTSDPRGIVGNNIYLNREGSAPVPAGSGTFIPVARALDLHAILVGGFLSDAYSRQCRIRSSKYFM